jgi:5-methylcytosine-specific restriction endonuclease McrA
MSPSRIARPCSVYPCPEPATVKGKCAAHARQADTARNATRSGSLSVYRSTRWRRLRARLLRDRPWCEDPAGCREAATDVDHVVPIAAGGDPWDEGNLRPLCHRHHSRKTATIDRRRERERGVAIAADPRPRTVGEQRAIRRGATRKIPGVGVRA